MSRQHIAERLAFALAAILKGGKTELEAVFLWGNKSGMKAGLQLSKMKAAALKPYSKVVDWSKL